MYHYFIISYKTEAIDYLRSLITSYTKYIEKREYLASLLTDHLHLFQVLSVEKYQDVIKITDIIPLADRIKTVEQMDLLCIDVLESDAAKKLPSSIHRTAYELLRAFENSLPNLKIKTLPKIALSAKLNNNLSMRVIFKMNKHPISLRS